MKKIVEICCGSVADCEIAEYGGAERVELNSALFLGGLTPSLATMVLARAKTKLSIIAMVRPRGAGFCYDESEIEVMFEDASLLLEAGADGLAFGFLNKDYTINKEQTQKMVELIHKHNKEAVFHRAFDCVNDVDQAMLDLIECKVDRVLTSGLQSKAIEGLDTIKHLVNKYGKHIEILAGSGVNDTNAIEIFEKTGVNQIHSSCKDWATDKTTTNNNVTYAYNGKYEYDVVSLDKVKKLVEVVRGKNDEKSV